MLPVIWPVNWLMQSGQSKLLVTYSNIMQLSVSDSHNWVQIKLSVTISPLKQREIHVNVNDKKEINCGNNLIPTVSRSILNLLSQKAVCSLLVKSCDEATGLNLAAYTKQLQTTNTHTNCLVWRPCDLQTVSKRMTCSDSPWECVLR